ncbi:MAG: light-regulated signal transduction histidine kinase (bacteriophytochrome) [Polaribacter sp.]
MGSYIKNNGRGIKDKYFDKAFEAFKKLDKK